jgi:hypothetical protein
MVLDLLFEKAPHSGALLYTYIPAEMNLNWEFAKKSKREARRSFTGP